MTSKVVLGILFIAALFYWIDYAVFKYQLKHGDKQDVSLCLNCGCLSKNWDLYQCPVCKQRKFDRGVMLTSVGHTLFHGPLLNTEFLWYPRKPAPLAEYNE